MKYWFVSLLIVAFITSSFWFARDFLAGVAWEKYKNMELAMVLIRVNEGLAMDIGNYYFNGGAYDLVRARRAYQRAVAIDPAPQWGHYQLGRLDFIEGDFETALAEIEKELSAYPHNLRTLYAFGLIYSYRDMEGDLERAEEYFTRFIEWAPTEWAGYNDLVWVLTRQEKYDQAEAVIRNAFDVAPNTRENPWLWNNLGVAQLNRGAYSEARTSFEQARLFAGRLTLSEWLQAYPGNNPLDASGAFEEFKEAVEQNIRRADSLSLK